MCLCALKVSLGMSLQMLVDIESNITNLTVRHYASLVSFILNEVATSSTVIQKVASRSEFHNCTHVQDDNQLFPILISPTSHVFVVF
jgi:hypothetical protein